MPLVVVECAFDPPTNEDAVRATFAQLEKCLIVREVVAHGVYAAENGRRAIYLLEARDAESARNGFRSAGVAFERAWSATSVLGPART